MSLAEAMSARSTCPDGARNGAVLVRDGHVIATGYGSPASGVPPCTKCWLRELSSEDGSKAWEVCPSVHAETNAILMAARFGIVVEGSMMYVTKMPCDPCLRNMVNAGVDGFKIMDGKKVYEYPTRIPNRLRSSCEESVE
jgi:dCMP deaminase